MTSPELPLRVDFLSRYSKEISRWDQHLRCPVCAFDCNHLEAVAVNRGGKVVELRGQEASNEFTSIPTGRGSSVWIDLVCECGHLWTFRMQFHKGSIYFERCSRGTEKQDERVTTFWRD